MREEEGESRGTIGHLAIVLHSHMPYVEGFGTYPFGEEWLFDAACRSYLPVLEVAQRLTVTVTPVLADQLEDPGTRGRLRDFLLRYRVEAAQRDVEVVDDELRPAAEAELARYRHALELLDAAGGDVLDAFRRAQHEGGIALVPSSASHAVLPMLATRAGMRLQLETGLRSHRRRFGHAAGFWLPECAYRPGLEWDLAEHGVEWFCVDQSASERPLEALTPIATEAGPVAFPIDWEAVLWLWSLGGYPSDRAHLQFHTKSMAGMRLWRIGGEPYDPAAAAAAARRQADEFAAAAAVRLRRFRDRHGRPGLLVFAIDTELLGHWWAEGPQWLAAALEAVPAHGVRLVTLDEARGVHRPEPRPLRGSSWGEGKDLRTWDSPRVADLAGAARRLELRLLRALAQGTDGGRGERAARELLALQASDWAFLDIRGDAGDYPFQRATGHAEALLEALDSARPPHPHMRAFAPDLSLSSLLQP